MEEIWKDIDGYEGYYQVSNLGNVKSVDRYIKSPLNNQESVLRKGKQIKTNINKKNGYIYVCFYKENTQTSKRVHRLVAKAFLPNPDNLPQVNHIDGNKQNNNVNNLEWCSQLENIQHANKNGLINHYKRRVIQLDKDLNLIREWESITEASKELKIERANITACCNGKLKRAGGYVWKYL